MSADASLFDTIRSSLEREGSAWNDNHEHADGTDKAWSDTARDVAEQLGRPVIFMTTDGVSEARLTDWPRDDEERNRFHDVVDAELEKLSPKHAAQLRAARLRYQHEHQS